MENVKAKFMRDGKVLDPNGQEVGQAKAQAPEGGDSPPALKTGDLPPNFVGAGKLKEAGITTYEALRETDEATLKSSGLDDEQVKKVQEAAKAPARG